MSTGVLSLNLVTMKGAALVKSISAPLAFLNTNFLAIL
jgi:hypothetical protein